MLFIHDEDFLTEDEIANIDEIFNSTQDWHYSNILDKYEGISNIKYFTSDHEPGSLRSEAAMFILNKMLKKHNIDYSCIKRIKFNMTAPSERTIVAAPHRDMPDDHIIFLYYINDAFGDTIVYDGKDPEVLNIAHQVSPKRGSAILFDGNVHAWCTPHKGPMRQVINIVLTV